MTEIGEKGVNLSGGQRQRISIARAVYSNGDIYLVDDCLSALDAYVGKRVFYNVIKFLQSQGKTVVFVTNAIDYTEECDRVIVLDDGKIVEDGKPSKLIEQETSLFTQLKIQYKQSKNKEEEEEKDRKEKEEAEKKKKTQSESTEEAAVDIFEDEPKEGEVKEKKE